MLYIPEFLIIMKESEVNCMKKIEDKLTRVVLGIGYANWVIAVIISILLMILPTLFSTTSVTLFNYLTFSYIPALISLILTIKVKKEYRTINLTINIFFLLLYIILFKLLSYVIAHAT